MLVLGLALFPIVNYPPASYQVYLKAGEFLLHPAPLSFGDPVPRCDVGRDFYNVARPALNAYFGDIESFVGPSYPCGVTFEYYANHHKRLFFNNDSSMCFKGNVDPPPTPSRHQRPVCVYKRIFLVQSDLEVAPGGSIDVVVNTLAGDGLDIGICPVGLDNSIGENPNLDCVSFFTEADPADRLYERFSLPLTDLDLGPYSVVLMDQNKRRYETTSIFHHGDQFTWSPTPPPQHSRHSAPELKLLLPLVIIAPVLLLAIEITRCVRARS